MASILIVDDEEQMQRLLRRLVERSGHDCVCAGSAEEAKVCLERVPFDLALVDVRMPGESGLDLLTEIRSRWPEIAVVMVTGLDDPELAETAFTNGAYGYVVKPFKPTAVHINVASALRRRELEIENKKHREHLETAVAERTSELRSAVDQLAQAEEAVRASRAETIHRLAKAVESRSAETGLHIERMSLYAEDLARRIGFEEPRCELIHIASAMHDIGKVGTPDQILNKPGKLTPEEFEVIKKHSEIGYRIFADSTAELLTLAATIALTHHERWDGNGYPRGLAGEAIPIEGRIASIADVFDALMTKRVYKPAFSVDETVQIMREGRGTQFDPSLLDRFLEGLDDVLAIRARYPDDEELAPPRTLGAPQTTPA